MTDEYRSEIEAILDRAFSSEDPDEIDRIARQVLRSDPDNPEALILLADCAGEEEERVGILRKALAVVRSSMPEMDTREQVEDPIEDKGILYLAILQRLAFSLFTLGETTEAFDLSRRIVEMDPEDETFGKTLFYRCLLEMGEYGTILDFSDNDENRSPARAHARAIALFHVQGPSKDARGALWDLFEVGPDIPLFLIGYWGEPHEGDEQEMEDFNFTLLFEDPWNRSEDLLRWLTRATILFAYVTDRLNPEIMENIERLVEDLQIQQLFQERMKSLREEVLNLDEVRSRKRDLSAIRSLRALKW